MTAPGPARILVVEDDPEVRELLEEHLTALGHQTVSVASAHVRVARRDRHAEAGDDALGPIELIDEAFHAEKHRHTRLFEM